MRKTLVAVTGLILLLGAIYVGETLRYPRGTPAQPGPGLYPLLLGLLLIVGSCGTLVESLSQRLPDVESVWPTGPARWRMLAILLASLGYIVLLPYVGHSIAGTLSVLVVLRAMGVKRWLPAVVLAVAMGLGSYYLFGVILGVPLPTGIWEG